MDCEKFDRVVLDLLYEELDDITAAAARRHTEHCVRCRAIATKLKATREVGVLPLVDPPDGLEAQILAAERRARHELPIRERLGRTVSMLAGYAMRPQLAMAALLLLVIGSSLLLLRARPGEQKSVLVTERGVPEGEPETVALVPRRPSPASAPAAAPTEGKVAALSREARDDKAREERSREEKPASNERAKGATQPLAEAEAPSQSVESDRSYDQALAAYRDRRYAEAEKRFAEVAERGEENASSAALYSALATRARAGCSVAAPLFDSVHQKYPDAGPGREAAWQAAGCYRTLGDFEKARRQYEALLGLPGYADRAQAALASLGDNESAEVAARRAAAAAARPATEAKPAAPAAAPNPVGGTVDSSPPAKTSPR